MISHRYLLFVFAALQCGISTTFAQEDLSEIRQQAINAAVKKVADSVIQIETIGGLQTIEQTQTSSAPTSALIVSADGYALSSEFNFVKIPSAIFARLPDGQRINVSIVARDTNRQLVLLKLETDRTFSVPDFVDRENLSVGETAIALGRAYQHDAVNVSTGIISATHRIWNKAVQTDAKISPANYGGPLINLQGQIIGLLVPLSPRDSSAVAGSEWYDSGIGFAATLKPVLEKLDILKSGKDLVPGKLGISFKGTNIYRGQPEISVCPGHTPAGAMGLKPGDIVTHVDGQPVNRQAQILAALGPRYAGDSVSIQARRDNQVLNITATLVAEIEPFQPKFLGILPAHDSPDLQIASVIDDSPAQKAGLATGDKIVAINGNAVQSLPDLLHEIVGLEVGTEISIGLIRHGNEQTAKLNLAEMTGNVIEAAPQRPEELSTPAFDTAVKIPEFANQAHCYLPAHAPNEKLGLMVWVPEAGLVDHSKIWQQWMTHCETYGLGLLVPQSIDRKRWSPSESEFIAAAIQDVRSRLPIDGNRIAVGGTETGGFMAALMASQNRELVRGLAVIDADLPLAASTMSTDPNNPLHIFLATGNENPNIKKLDLAADQFRKNHFPVHRQLDLSQPLWQRQLSQWLFAIDRF